MFIIIFIFLLALVFGLSKFHPYHQPETSSSIPSKEDAHNLEVATVEDQKSTKAAPLWLKNQLGYLPSASKKLGLTALSFANQEFRVVNNADQSVVFSDVFSEVKIGNFSNTEYIDADVSSITTEGEYLLEVGNMSTSFTVTEPAYIDALKKTIKAYYYNRAGLALETEYADSFSRPAAHPDLLVIDFDEFQFFVLQTNEFRLNKFEVFLS